MKALQPTAEQYLLLAGFLAALLIRLIIGGSSVSTSLEAGLVFGVCLYLYAFFCGAEFIVNRKVVAAGLVGGAFLCLPAILIHLTSGDRFNPSSGYLAWAAATSFIAFAEEAFLRGVLFDSIQKSHGPKAAIVVTSILFAAIHLPMYGWQAIPLDLAVGLWLGCLRRWTGSFVAPGLAHVIADLVGWWLY